MQERGGAGCQHDVANQREAHTGAGGDAVYRNDDGYAQSMPGLDHRIEVFAQPRSDILAAAALGVAQKIIAHEIRSRAKSAAGGGEYDGANLGIGVDGRSRRTQIRDQRQIQRIQSVRAIEGDMGDAFSPLEEQSVELHCDPDGVGRNGLRHNETSTSTILIRRGAVNAHS